jgi:WhiB family redox-sensing transcriptional regulator
MNPVLVAWLMAPSPPDLPGIEDLLNRPAWQRRAACRGERIEVFVQSRGRIGYDRARSLCARCPVCEPCLAYALADDLMVGVWGGTTAQERRAMRSRRAVSGTEG